VIVPLYVRLLYWTLIFASVLLLFPFIGWWSVPAVVLVVAWLSGWAEAGKRIEP
jgi:hypothetical protein